MARFFLVLLSLIAGAAGAANLYLSAAEQGGHGRRHADEVLDAGARAFSLAIAADAELEVARKAAQRTTFQFTLADLAARGEAPNDLALRQARMAVGEGEAEPVIFIATSAGILATKGEEPLPLGDEQVPSLVREALSGAEGHGFASVDGKLHRIRALPVATGALAVAFPVNDAFAARLSRTLGTDVTFLHGGKAVASSLPMMDRAELAEAASGEGEGKFGFGARPASFSLTDFVELPLFTPWEGTVRASSRALGAGKGSLAVLSVPTRATVGALVDRQKRDLLLWGLVAVLGFFFAAIGGSGRKRAASEVGLLADVAERAAEGDVNAQAPEYLPGDLGRLARAMNLLASRQAPGLAAEVSHAFLSSAEEPPADVADAFPFGGEPSPVEPRFVQDEEMEEEPAQRFDEAPPSLDRFFEAMDPAERTPEPAHSFDAPEPERSFPEATEPTQRDAPLPFGSAHEFPFGHPEGEEPAALAGGLAPWDQPTRPLPSIAAKARKEPAEPFGEEGTTRLPPELMAQLAKMPEPEEPAPLEEDEEEAHLREVFDRFVAMRQECGESSVGLQFERFATKLRTNRAQLVEKYRCKTVRFTVYAKDGRAALKATPVR